jgi:hypothetical protein
MSDRETRQAALLKQREEAEAANAALLKAAQAEAEAALPDNGPVKIGLWGENVWGLSWNGAKSSCSGTSVQDCISQALEIIAKKAKPVVHERPMPAVPEPEATKPADPPPEVVKNAPEPEPVVVAEPDPEAVAWADLIPADASPEQIAEVRGGLLARWRYFQHFRIDSARSARDRALPDLSDEERVEFEDLERRNAIFKWLD